MPVRTPECSRYLALEAAWLNLRISEFKITLHFYSIPFKVTPPVNTLLVSWKKFWRGGAREGDS
jgi:hypothetical protein